MIAAAKARRHKRSQLAAYDSHRYRILISEDPIGLAGGINPYVYAGNDPINASDPLGLQTCQAPPNPDEPMRCTFPEIVTRATRLPRPWMFNPNRSGWMTARGNMPAFTGDPGGGLFDQVAHHFDVPADACSVENSQLAVSIGADVVGVGWLEGIGATLKVARATAQFGDAISFTRFVSASPANIMTSLPVGGSNIGGVTFRGNTRIQPLYTLAGFTPFGSLQAFVERGVACRARR